MSSWASWTARASDSRTGAACALIAVLLRPEGSSSAWTAVILPPLVVTWTCTGPKRVDSAGPVKVPSAKATVALPAGAVVAVLGFDEPPPPLAGPAAAGARPDDAPADEPAGV